MLISHCVSVSCSCLRGWSLYDDLKFMNVSGKYECSLVDFILSIIKLVNLKDNLGVYYISCMGGLYESYQGGSYDNFWIDSRDD